MWNKIVSLIILLILILCFMDGCENGKQDDKKAGGSSSNTSSQDMQTDIVIDNVSKTITDDPSIKINLIDSALKLLEYGENAIDQIRRDTYESIIALSNEEYKRNSHESAKRFLSVANSYIKHYQSLNVIIPYVVFELFSIYDHKSKCKSNYIYYYLVSNGDKEYDVNNYGLANAYYAEAIRYRDIPKMSMFNYIYSRAMLFKDNFNLFNNEYRSDLLNNKYEKVIAKADELLASIEYFEGKSFQTLFSDDKGKPMKYSFFKDYLNSIKNEAEQTKNQYEYKKMLDQMFTYENIVGDVFIAVDECVLKKHISYSDLKDNNWFICIQVFALNKGWNTELINPNQFTLSSPEGYTVSYDKSTFYLNEYLNSVNVPPGGYTSGWLVFVLPQEGYYVLNYEWMGNKATKKVYITSIVKDVKRKHQANNTMSNTVHIVEKANSNKPVDAKEFLRNLELEVEKQQNEYDESDDW